MKPPAYTPRLVEEVTELLGEYFNMHVKQSIEMCEILSAITGRDIKPCPICQRPMIPARLWKCIPGHARHGIFVQAGSAGHCSTDYKDMLRRGEITPEYRNRLSESELEKLRKLAAG